MNLELEDARVEQRYLEIMGKGSKERLVPIGSHTQKCIITRDIAVGIDAQANSNLHADAGYLSKIILAIDPGT